MYILISTSLYFLELPRWIEIEAMLRSAVIHTTLPTFFFPLAPLPAIPVNSCGIHDACSIARLEVVV